MRTYKLALVGGIPELVEVDNECDLKIFCPIYSLIGM